MNLLEYQAKQILSEHGIPTPAGMTATNAGEVEQIALELDGPVVIKPQLGIKRRGKLGIIAFADSPSNAQQEADRLIKLTINGEPIKTLLVETKVDIMEEYYLAVAVDYTQRCPILMVSKRGGVEIEELTRDEPQNILKVPISILRGPTKDDIAAIAALLDQDTAQLTELLYGIFRQYDAEVVEINPLVRTKDGQLVAVDAVLNINDASLYRQSWTTSLKPPLGGIEAIIQEAVAHKWTYIDLPGDIAILSSGAGLTMTILDLIQLADGSAANFLDTAQINEEGIYQAFGLIMRAKPVSAILVNMFAGLNQCDRLSAGIVRYLTNHPIQTPLVVRMIGNQEEMGHRILRESGIEPYTSLEEAVEQVVRVAKNQIT